MPAWKLALICSLIDGTIRTRGYIDLAFIERFWLRYRAALLWVGIVLMILASAHRLTNEFHRLLFDQGPDGAIDLRYRHNDVQRWFSGLPLDEHAIYPPATYLMLWPLLSWVTQDQARWLWAVTSAAAMVWLMVLLVRQSQAKDLQQRLFVALLVPSIYATGATIGNGQFILHLLPFLITALLRCSADVSSAQCSQAGRPRYFSNDLLIAICFLVALIKPALTAPFFWILMFCPPRMRPALFVCAGYTVLTMLAILPQQSEFGVLISDWLARGSAAALRGGYANLHSWLNLLNLQHWILPASLLLLAALGFWIFYFRNSEYWILMGVTAYFSRFWIYHRLYDDFLVLIPMISLFRIAVTNSTVSLKFCAGVILTITWAAALAPARLLSFPLPYNILFEAGQTSIWMVGLVFLMYMAKQREYRKFAGGTPAPLFEQNS
ncbi:hypothetical protein L0222_25700 [bacterium]|nr:hypothetical protein [bacterium]MCI0604253.1 hypothetical protein [bacterium]